MTYRWRSWLRKWLSWATKRGTRWVSKFAIPRRLAVEHLEDRVVPVAPPWAVSMAGDGTQVVFSPLGDAQTYTITAYEPQFVDGSRIAIGDTTSDGVPDLVTIAGYGGGPRVIVFDGASGKESSTFFAFEPEFRGGGYVAVEDVDGDEVPDIIVGAGESGSPRVRVISGKSGATLFDFFAFSETTRTGVRVASADVNRDGYADIIAAPGIGGSSQVRVFSGKTGEKLQEFQAFASSSQGGAFIAAGDVNRDGQADIIVGAGQGDAPQMRAFSGGDLSVLATVDVYESTFHGGVRVAVGGNVDGTVTSIWTAAGDGGGPRVREFDATTMTVKADRFVFDPNHRGGITVAAGFIATQSMPVSPLPPVVPGLPPVVVPPAIPPNVPPVVPPVILPGVPPNVPPVVPPTVPPPPVVPPIIIPPPPPVPISLDLAGWTVAETGGSTGNRGTVTGTQDGAVLREGNSFTTTFARSFVVPATASVLSFGFRSPLFDRNDTGFVHDAFEVALLDDRGRPLVDPISSGRDAYYNRTEGNTPAVLGKNTTASGDTVTVDLSSVAAGTTTTLVFRLINNDRDTGSTVTIRSVGLPSTDVAISPVKFFVVDPSTDTTYRYGDEGLTAGQSDLGQSVGNARGVASNPAGDTVWVVDATTKQVSVFDASGVAKGSWTATDSVNPVGVTVQNGDLWLVDSATQRVNRYDGGAVRRDGMAQASNGFALDALNGSPSDLVTDGTTIWVTDDVAAKVFVYDVVGASLGSWQLDGDNKSPSGLTINPSGGTELWVVDRSSRQVYRYAEGRELHSGMAQASNTFLLDALNSNPEGIADPPATVIDYTTFSDQSLLTLNGVSGTLNATPPDFNGKLVLRLTDGPRQSGSVFVTAPVELSDDRGFRASFSTKFQFRISDSAGIGDGDGSGADGFVFVIQTNSNSVGGSGGGIGYSGIENSLGIEFDTFNNQSEGVSSDSDNHVGIDLNGSVESVAVKSISPRFNNAVPWTAWVDYDGSANLLQVRISQSDNRPFDADLTLETDLPALLKQPSAYIGFTSGTFSGWAKHDILSWQFRNSFTPFDVGQVSISASIPGDDFLSEPIRQITGQATSTTSSGVLKEIISVAIDGSPVDVLDSTGRFFSNVMIKSGLNRFTVVATDESGQIATTFVESAGPRIDGRIDFSQFTDLTSTFIGEYSRTSFDTDSKTLFADVAVRNLGQYPANVPLYVGVKNISDPAVQVLQAAGTLPDGTPYYDFTGLVSAGMTRLEPNATTGTLSLTFANPNRGRFTYDLVFLGVLNRGPTFTSLPKLEAPIDRTYRYAATAIDPDQDSLTYSLTSSPVGMMIDSSTGVITWTPTTEQKGNHQVALTVSDGRGGTASQGFTVVADIAPPNRPPVFTSVPTLDAEVGEVYTYQASAADADGDTLAYSLSGTVLAGMQIDPASGQINWTPSVAQRDDQTVSITVTDGNGGTATQTYLVCVKNSRNRAPVIVSEPVTTALIVAGTELRIRNLLTVPFGVFGTGFGW